MSTFALETALDDNDGEASRANKAFAMLYAGMRLAQYFDLLPQDWDALAITMRCHALNREAVLHRRPFRTRLESYASQRDLVHLERGKLPEMTHKEVVSCPGFIRERGGQTPLMMSVPAYHRAFPDWRRLKASNVGSCISMLTSSIIQSNWCEGTVKSCGSYLSSSIKERWGSFRGSLTSGRNPP